MGVNVLNDADARAFLSRHPEITYDTIPTYGQSVSDGGRQYLVAIDGSTGETRVIDVTPSYQGEPLDPKDLPIYRAESSIFDAINWAGSTMSTVASQAAGTLSLALVAAIVIGGWLLLREAKK